MHTTSDINLKNSDLDEFKKQSRQGRHTIMCSVLYDSLYFKTNARQNV